MSGFPTKTTKIDMARDIVQALYRMQFSPARDDRRVLRMAKRSVKTLTPQHKLAMKILSDATLPQTRALAETTLQLSDPD